MPEENSEFLVEVGEVGGSSGFRSEVSGELDFFFLILCIKATKKLAKKIFE